jgi:lipoprotein-anchoring transpeptidase ErfK/SrfK
LAPDLHPSIPFGGTDMHPMEDQIKRLAAVMSVMAMAAAEALAQETAAGSARRIVVSLADRKLAVVEAGKTVKVFSTAVGAPSTPSPTGTFNIVQRVANPTWYHKGKIVGPGRSNPVGPRWLGLSVKGYGIHGTNRPSSIGHNASHGCIRLKNSDIEELFEMVSVGDEVAIVGDRNEETARLFPQPVAKPEAAPVAVVQAPAVRAAQASSGTVQAAGPVAVAQVAMATAAGSR